MATYSNPIRAAAADGPHAEVSLLRCGPPAPSLGCFRLVCERPHTCRRATRASGRPADTEEDMQVDDVQQPRRPPESRRSAVAPSTPTEVAFMGLNSQTRGRSVVLALLASGFAFLTTGLAWPNPNVHVVTPSHTVQRLRHGPATTPIQHVVVIIQENRTVDNIFNGFPGADTAQGGYDSHGNFHELRPISFSNTCGPSHSHGQFVTEFNGGSNNGWDLGSYSCTGSSTLPDGLFAYVQPSETEEYWAVASNYGLADEVLQTSEGPSFPAHQYLIAGQAGGHGSDAPWGFAENGGG